MSGVTLNQIATRIAGEQGERRDDTSFITQCETWLKSAMIEIDSSGNFQVFRKNLTITTDPLNTQGLYELPEDFRTFKYLREVLTDNPIEYIDPKVLADYNLDFEQFGPPRNYWITDPTVNGSNQFIQRLQFFPIPNEALTVDGMYYFDIINTGSDDILPLTQRAIIALEHRLRMYIRDADKEWTAYNVSRGEYGRALALVLMEEKNKPSRNLRARNTDLPFRSRRPRRFRYPFEG